VLPHILAVGLPLAARLLLNELMIRPLAGGSEWVELLNGGDAPAALGELTLEDARAKPARLTAAREALEPGGFLIVAANRTHFLDAWIGLDEGRVAGVTGGWPTLNDGDGSDGYADRIVLRGRGGVALDSLTYTAAWLGATGVSVERIDPAGLTPLAANWSPCALAVGATPLGANSLAPRPGVDDRAGLSVPRAPFHPGVEPAVITWRLPAASDLALTIFDLSGRALRLLRPLESASPVGRVAWDGTDDAGARCPDGVYLVLLESRAEAEPAVRRWQRPLVLVRGSR
jgi:hypothetical protein